MSDQTDALHRPVDTMLVDLLRESGMPPDDSFVTGASPRRRY